MEFCALNAQACPVIDVIRPGEVTSALAAGSDIRTDIPAYRVWQNGELTGETDDVTSVWRDDLVEILIGCSFTFEAALVKEGIPLRHVKMGRNVPMYRTTVECTPAGRIHGPMVVSMRPMPPELVATAARITGEVPQVQGAPIHVGSPDKIGILDINRPDFRQLLHPRKPGLIYPVTRVPNQTAIFKRRKNPHGRYRSARGQVKGSAARRPTRFR